MTNPESPHIGTLGESDLHATLKAYYAKPGDKIETIVDGYVIDIVQGQTLIEIQTGSFSNMKKKLTALLPEHSVRLVHPIIRDKWIVRVSKDGELLKRRKSPKRGRVEDAFKELLYITEQALHPNFTLSVVFIQADEYWHDDGKGSWRRKHWSIANRKVKQILEEKTFRQAEDFLELIPDNVTDPFTNKQLATALRLSSRLTGKMTYVFRKMNLIDVVGKQGRANLFSRQV